MQLCVSFALWLGPCEVCIRNRLTAGAQLLNDPRHLHRIPDHRGVREQTQTRRLVHDLFVITGLKRPLIGEKEMTGDLVPSLAPVELQLHPRPEVLLLDVGPNPTLTLLANLKRFYFNNLVETHCRKAP